ncbi:MAG: septal ring lytic transglycosylase RlpA family protein [Bacteroidetes bacterium]|nr:septal ring lytic transglycosylase RlpA family protein [Bacteroidota bacterium]
MDDRNSFEHKGPELDSHSHRSIFVAFALPAVALGFAVFLAGCASAVRFTFPGPGTVAPQPTMPNASNVPPLLTIDGIASYYSTGFNGKRTASGEIFNKNALTAANREFPFGTLLRVTNLGNGESVEVTVNDRGPFDMSRIIDLSEAAARDIGMIQAGTARVRIQVLKWGTTDTTGDGS